MEHCPRISLKRERKKLSPSPSLYSSVAVLKPQGPSKEPQQLSRQPVPMLGHQHSEDVFWWSGEAPVLCFVLFLGTIWQSLTLFLPSVPRQVGSPSPVPLPQAEQPWLPAVLADAPALCSASRPFGLCLCARLPGAGAWDWSWCSSCAPVLSRTGRCSIPHPLSASGVWLLGIWRGRLRAGTALNAHLIVWGLEITKSS